MSTSMTISIGFFAVAAIVVLIALGWVLVNKRKQHRHAKANEIRERAKDEALQVDRRDALAEETAAKARAAQADADVKAAQASVLEQQAAAHRSEAKTSRAQLDEQRDRADAIDPASQTPEETKSAGRK
jgi:regulatory protein YycI of two-component signal transduction system YycFG